VRGQTKRGEPCGTTPGGLCFFHANPNKAAELGRIGGGKKGRLPAGVVDPLPGLTRRVRCETLGSQLRMYTRVGFIPGSRPASRREEPQSHSPENYTAHN
jgi:hypothetical protein